ncbi:MAG: type II toxin-antitoxin system CcdA family antitoxin [Gammaproteobacteria bacterium]|nr:type II toxin-antitoxin system CcdA family antitoxin [Gammaproteobacteria bacterium]
MRMWGDDMGLAIYETAAKQATNLSINSDLLRQAKELKIDILRAAEERLAERIRAERERQLRASSRASCLWEKPGRASLS